MTSILDNVKHLPKGLPIRIEEETYHQKGILSHQFGGLYMQSSDGWVRHIRHAWNSFLKHTLNPDAEVLKNLPLEDMLDHFYLDKEVDGFKVSLKQLLSWPVEKIKSCHRSDPFRKALHWMGHPIPVICQGRNYTFTVTPWASDSSKGILNLDGSGKEQILIHPTLCSIEPFLETVVLQADKTLTLRALLEWSAAEIQAFLSPAVAVAATISQATATATCPPAVATATATATETATATATATCSPPQTTHWPEMPEELKRLERIHLSSLLDCTMTVRVELGTRGVLKAELHPDGTFSYDDGEVEFMGLNSFELLYYYRRHFPQENDSLADLDVLIDLDYEMALGFIYFFTDTRPLLDRVKEFYADMPPLAPIGSAITEPDPEDPDPLCLFMARLEDKEAIYRRELRILEAIEEKQRVVKDLEAQVALMRTRVGI